MKIAFAGASGYGNIGDDTYPLVYSSLLPEHELSFYNSDLPKSIDSSVGLLVMGGGGILHNAGNRDKNGKPHHVKCMQFYMDWAIANRVIWGFHSCGFQFLGDEETRFQEAFSHWKPYFERADFLIMRSPRCAQMCAELSGRKDVQFIPDLAYLFSPQVISHQGLKTLVIVPAGCVNPRDDFTRHLIRLFAASHHRVIWLSMGAHRDDDSVMLEARQSFPEAEFVVPNSPTEAYECIATASFVYSGRYHGMIYARTAGVPFLVPQVAPYKIVQESFETPLARAFEHQAVLAEYAKNIRS